MGAVNALQGSISSGATDGPTKDLLDNLGIDGCTLNINRPAVDSTVDGSNYKGVLPGLYTWTVTCPFKFPATPQHGHKPTSGAAFITGTSNAYVTNVKAFDVTIAVPVVPDTDDTATAGETYIYGDVIAATGTYTANVDSTDALVLPGTTDTAVFTIGDETNDNQLIIPILTTVTNVVRSRGSVTEVQYSFESNGTIQYEGDSSPFGNVGTTATNWPVPHTIAKDNLAAITVTHATGRTASGDAFYTSFQISRTTGDVINGTLSLQGNGALTLA